MVAELEKKVLSSSQIPPKYQYHMYPQIKPALSFECLKTSNA
jgi:hypothetical protein